jgi:carbon monoxide dehydrogenase subunit G
MERLTNEFRVGVPVGDAWKVLTDVERIAPMLPGAQLQEVEGDEYRGVVKVKVGPITAQYKGTATFVEQDPEAGRVVLKATGRDTRGQGNASALITATMVPDGDGTKVKVETDLTITGKVAQFGRGVLADVSAKLIGQFVDALEADLAARPPSAGAEPAATDRAGAEPAATDRAGAEPAATDRAGGSANGSATSAGAPAAPAGGSAASTGPRRIDAPEAEPLDLLAVAGGSTAKRLLPLAGVLALVVAVLLRRRSRR